jgi:hypothetical protein
MGREGGREGGRTVPCEMNLVGVSVSCTCTLHIPRVGIFTTREGEREHSLARGEACESMNAETGDSRLLGWKRRWQNGKSRVPSCLSEI